jgi:hypothetical protein
VTERAEIEAAVHSSRIYAAAAALKPWIGSSVEAATLAVKMAVAAVEAADRVRDARGDEGKRDIMDVFRSDEAMRAFGVERSPQGEDHETVGRRTVETVLGPLKVVPECRAQAVCVNGSKCWEAGRCLRPPQDEADEAGIEAAAQAMLDNQGGRPAIDQARIAVAAYLSCVSPSRDGTVAVEALREAARKLISVYMADGDLDAAMNELEAAAGFSQQGAGESNEGGNQ